MEKVFRYSFLLCAAALLPACAGEPDLEPDSSPVQEDCVYMDVGLSFSSGEVRTRSNTGDPSDGYVTSDDGTEPGKDRENAIAEVLLLIADTQDNNIAAGLLETSGDGLDFVIPVPFRQLKDHAGEEVHVYVFCNPTDKLKSLAVNTPEGTLPSDFKDMEHTLQDFTEDHIKEGAGGKAEAERQKKASHIAEGRAQQGSKHRGKSCGSGRKHCFCP